MIDPPLPIRQPIREVDTRRRVVKEIIPESLSTFSLHRGCNRTAASIVGEKVSSKNCVSTSYKHHKMHRRKKSYHEKYIRSASEKCRPLGDHVSSIIEMVTKHIRVSVVMGKLGFSMR